ncbi:MAG: class I SAM-dependent methyltransferase, partial [Candidatus Omnitrophica bacterium]|nr:class I SAM-dependent methyltransferase [Candidatus Omnitrophota bacterium]
VRTIQEIVRLRDEEYKDVFLVLNACVGSINVESIEQTARFLIELNPNDVKLLVIAQDRGLVVSHKSELVILRLKKLLDGYPKERFVLLRAKIDSLFDPDAVGLQDRKAQIVMEHCFVPITERTIDATHYYPCSIYVRYYGEPLGLLSESFAEQQSKVMEFARRHDCRKDPICSKNCTTCCKLFNVRTNQELAAEAVQVIEIRDDITEQEITVTMERARALIESGQPSDRPFLIIKPHGQQWRDQIIAFLVKNGFDIESITQIAKWEEAARFVYGWPLRKEKIRFSLEIDRVFRMIEQGPADILRFNVDLSCDSLLKAKHAIRSLFPTKRFQLVISGKKRWIRLTAVHTPDPSDIRRENAILDALLRGLRPSSPVAEAVILPVEIRRSINHINRAGVCEAKINEILDKLADYVLNHPHQVKDIIDNLGTVMLKDKFIGLLAQKDPARPRFDVKIPPHALLPMNKVATSLDDQDALPRLETATIEWREDKIWLDLWLRPRSESLATLVIQPSNTLDITVVGPDLPAYIEKILRNKTSAYYKGQDAWIWYNLNWMAVVRWFHLEEPLRHAGIDTFWYQEQIEPFLKKCGFKYAAVIGTCLEAEDIEEFWHRQGFSGSFEFKIVYRRGDVRYYISVKRLNARCSSSPVKKTRHVPSVKGKRRLGVSRWDLLDEFRRGLNDLPQAVILKLAAASDTGSQRKILMEAGLGVANEIDGKFFISAVARLLESLPLSAEDAARSNYLRYGGNGRYLTAYIGEYFDFIVKTYSDPTKKKIVQAEWIENGFAVARQRLEGLAVPTLIIDSAATKKDFVYILEDGSLVRTDLAIIQEKIIRLLDHLKILVRSNRIQEAKDLLDKFKETVILMFRRGVVDTDFGGMLANYGIKPKTGQMLIFDFGDLSYSSDYADGFIGSLLTTNQYIEDGLRSEVNGTIANYFRHNAFKYSDFKDGELFAVDLARKAQAALTMKFPYREKEIRKMFAASSSSPVNDNAEYLERELKAFFKGKLISEYTLPDTGEKVTYTGGASHDFYYLRAKDIFIIDAIFYNQLKELCDIKGVIVLFIEKVHPYMSTCYFPWTLSVLTAMQRIDLRGKKIVDFGAGEGIPLLAAVKLGASRAAGIDYFNGALSTLFRNAQLNNCADNVYCIHDKFENLKQAKRDVLEEINLAVINMDAFGKTYFQELEVYLRRADFIIISGARYRNFPAFGRERGLHTYDAEYFKAARQAAKKALSEDGFEIVGWSDLVLERIDMPEVYPAFIVRPLRNSSSPLKAFKFIEQMILPDRLAKFLKLVSLKERIPWESIMERLKYTIAYTNYGPEMLNDISASLVRSEDGINFELIDGSIEQKLVNLLELLGFVNLKRIAEYYSGGRKVGPEELFTWSDGYNYPLEETLIFMGMSNTYILPQIQAARPAVYLDLMCGEAAFALEVAKADPAIKVFALDAYAGSILASLMRLIKLPNRPANFNLLLANARLSQDGIPLEADSVDFITLLNRPFLLGEDDIMRYEIWKEMLRVAKNNCRIAWHEAGSVFLKFLYFMDTQKQKVELVNLTEQPVNEHSAIYSFNVLKISSPVVNAPLSGREYNCT